MIFSRAPLNPPPLLSPSRRSPVSRNLTVRPAYARQLIPCADGGTVALDWWTGPAGWPGEAGHEGAPPPLPPTAPLLLVLHGLTGSGTEGYVKGACLAARASGWRAAVLTYRGCGGLALTSPLPYTATGTADAAAGLAAAAAAFPRAAATAAVGFSLGAIILTKFLAEAEGGRWPAAPPLLAALAISSPFCLASASARLAEPWTPGWVYDRILAHRLGSYFKEHEGSLSGHPVVQEALAAGATRTARTVGAWDAAVVARLAGHEDRPAYYAAASSAAAIPAIVRTPTLFLAAGDDPFLGDLPEVEVAGSPVAALAVSPWGGHCAFLQGARGGGVWPGGRAWCDDVLVQWLEAVRAEGAASRL